MALETLNTAPATVAASEEPQGAIPYQPAKSTGIGKLALDPTQTQDILANMQKYIDEREGFMPSLARGLTRGMATAYGPSALAATDRQQQLEDKQIMDYRTQMATFRAAQEKAKSDAAKWSQYSGTGAGGAGGAGGIQIPQSQLQKEALAGTDAERIALRQEFLKTKTTEDMKADLNPASLDRKDVLITDPQTGKSTLQPLNAFQYRQAVAAGLIKDVGDFYKMPKSTGAAAPATGGADVVPALQKAVFSTESSSGKADTTKPGVQGAIGPMQVTPDTFDTAKRLKLIPSDYDINNPAHNKDTGNRLLAYYHNKYQDPDKALAAYIGGEGAINKDGTINLERKDALGTTIGQYIAVNKAKAGLGGPSAPGVQVASTERGIPDIAGMLAERKIAEERGTAAGKAFGTSGEAMRTAFENDIDPGTLDDSYATSRRIQTLVKGDPTLSGVLNQAGVAPAIAGVLQKGIGNFGIQDLDNAIYKALPKTTQESLGERSELITYLAKIELQTAKLIKGQGQITEGEREILQRASSSISDPAELIYKKARTLERVTKMNEELAAVYGDGGKYADFRQFKNEPEFKRIHKEFRKDLEEILNEKVSFNRTKPGSAPAKTKHPTDIQAILDRNKSKAPQ